MKKADPLEGKFRPAIPNDGHDLILLFAIAARVVSYNSGRVEEVSRKLNGMLRRVGPPVHLIAQGCFKLWQPFGRLATSDNERIRVEAGRAFVRDLEQVGRSLELAPLPSWSKLPLGVDDPHAVDLEASEVTEPGESQAAVQARIKAVGEQSLTIESAAEYLRVIAQPEMADLLRESLQKGVVSRGDAQLIARWATSLDKSVEDQGALGDAVLALAQWMAKR